MIFLLQVACELDKLLKCGVGEELELVYRLRGEIDELSTVKTAMALRLSNMSRQLHTTSGKISSLLSENSGLVSECKSLSTTIKSQVVNISEANQSIAQLKVDHEVDLKMVILEKDEIKKELVGVREDFTTLEEESLKLFEEGYRNY